MVSPTQAVPEVPFVWGNNVKRAIVCRRYTIMVAQIHHLKPHHNPHHNPHQKSLSTTLPLSRTSGTLLWGGYSLPHTNGTSGTACVGLTIIACLRHAARSTRCNPPSNPLLHSLQSAFNFTISTRCNPPSIPLLRSLHTAVKFLIIFLSVL